MSKLQPISLLRNPEGHLHGTTVASFTLTEPAVRGKDPLCGRKGKDPGYLSHDYVPYGSIADDPIYWPCSLYPSVFSCLECSREIRLPFQQGVMTIAIVGAFF
jgi:hypothetical protein